MRAGGVLNDLSRFDPGELVEEPAAARVHQHRVTLHFQQFECDDLFVLAQF